MSSSVDPPDILIARYLAAEITGAEARALEAKLAQSPLLRRRVEEIRLLLGADMSSATWDAERMWSEHRSRTRRAGGVGGDRRDAFAGSAARATSGSIGGLRRLGQETSFAGLAAAVVLLAVGGATVWFAVRGDTPKVQPAREAAAEYSTTRGQYATIQLTDGSRVTLAPQSHLTIPPGFGPDLRGVTLDGEAIFSVRHDAAHPFRVHAHGAQVEDLGTRFDLRAYATDAAVTVVVAEGAVALRRDGGPAGTENGLAAAGVVVNRGDEASLDSRGRVSTTRIARLIAAIGWADGRLSFVRRPLPEVLETIGRWYDFDIRVPDPSLASRLVTAEFSTQSPDEMIRALAIAMDASVERHGRIITFHAR